MSDVIGVALSGTDADGMARVALYPLAPDTQSDRIRTVLAALRSTQEWIAGEPERHRQAMLIGAQAEALEQIERIVSSDRGVFPPVT